ncbi:MAG TPA: glycosyltransferase [Blastocatellia bacterium]|nr:glycosyltransferase [Blastocatellia bacterium]
MRIVFVADARSAISRSWIAYFVKRGDDVHVISTYPCAGDVIGGAQVHQLPVAFSGFSRISHNGMVASNRQPSLFARALAGLRIGALSNLSTTARFWLGPVELNRHVARARDLLTSINPDVVHAMRIPFEGIIAAKATPARFPLLISVWGNDFTLIARRYPMVARQTRRTLERADALHCDCRRDLKLAERDWGFSRQKPSAVLPGAGGIETSLFNPEGDMSGLRESLDIPVDAPVVINPRGFRGYVRNDIFFQSIPLVLEKHPRALFLCVGMQGNPVAEKWMNQLAIRDSVRLLPAAPHKEMAALFRLADVTVSPSLHDGTPNSLLEAMACGCFPVAGDIESVREWIIEGENGLICDATSRESVACALARALEDQGLRDRAREVNLKLIAERAEYGRVMREAENFYSRVVSRSERAAKV